MADNEAYIRKFLSGSLSPEEETEFKSRLKSDDELYAEYLLETKGKEYIRARAMLEEIENDPDLPRVQAEVDAYMEAIRKDKDSGQQAVKPREENTPPSKMSSLKILLWTIPAAMLIGVVLIFRLYMSPDPNIRLYNKYYDPLSKEVFDQELTRGESDATLFEGVQCYLEGDYSGAISKLETISDGSFVLGLSLLGLGQYEDALAPLKGFHADHPDHPESGSPRDGR